MTEQKNRKSEKIAADKDRLVKIAADKDRLVKIQRFLQFIEKVDGRYVLTEDYEPQGKITKELSGILKRTFPELSEKDFEIAEEQLEHEYARSVLK